MPPGHNNKQQHTLSSRRSSETRLGCRGCRDAAAAPPHSCGIQEQPLAVSPFSGGKSLTEAESKPQMSSVTSAANVSYSESQH